jgi:hypothetical protein
MRLQDGGRLRTKRAVLEMSDRLLKQAKMPVLHEQTRTVIRMAEFVKSRTRPATRQATRHGNVSGEHLSERSPGWHSIDSAGSRLRRVTVRLTATGRVVSLK